MSRRLRTVLAAAAALAALVPAAGPGLVLDTPLSFAGSAAAATVLKRTGSLTVTPGRYIPGQALRFRGNLGVDGRNRVHLESHMNRPGDTWLEVRNSSFRTDAQGRFDFRFRAPAMVNISYRVAGAGRVTNAERFNANPQELTLTPVKGSPDFPFYRVRPRSRINLVADTTPAIKTEFGTPAPIPGRTVKLQERVAPDRWRTLKSGRTDRAGNVYFSVKAPKSGTRVLRARQEKWTVGANDIGWYASFPAYFVASGSAAPDGPRTTGLNPTYTTQSKHRPTASQRFSWGAAEWDYAWDGGHSLDTPPSRGEVHRGKWQASSNGTGRVTPFNGGMVLQSKFKKVGPGDRGTTSAMLQGVAQERGRWEFRIQGRPWETGARNYRFRVELVPAGTSGSTCASKKVLVAAFTMTKRGMRFGVRSAKTDTAWRGKLPNVLLAERPFNVAVEVGKDHITWFRDGQPVGTVKNRHALPGVKLVPRLSLVGKNVEMNGAQVNSDWQRSWNLQRGKQVRNGDPLRRTGYRGC